MNDQKIIKTFRKGNIQKALKALYEHYPNVSRWIQANGGSESDAKDMFQEALVVLCKRLHQPEFQPKVGVSNYLFGTAKYLWFNELKKRDTHVEVLDEHVADVSETVSMHLEREESFKALDQVLARLTAKCREVLRLFYFERSSMSDIAKKMGLKGENAAKTRKYKCLEAAKKLASLPHKQKETQLS